jgi:dihydroxyacetone kinase
MGTSFGGCTSGALRGADAPVQGKVALVIGGGSGHKPAFAGYVGSGGADGAVVGDVFTSPTPDMALAVTQAVDPVLRTGLSTSTLIELGDTR